MRISDIKKEEIASANNMDSIWYITKQNLLFSDLCYISHILEDWNNDVSENYESFFDRNKTRKEYGSLSDNTPHRATINCISAGLLKTNEPYDSNNLTSLYYDIKKRCNGDFSNVESYQDIINNHLQSFTLKVNQNIINVLLFLFKIIIQIGDTTEEYKVTVNEFKLFIATSSVWNDYLKVADSILRYRNDDIYKKECDDAKTSNIQDVRIHKFLVNHEFLKIEDKDLILKKQFILQARKIVADFEVNGTTEGKYNLNFTVLKNTSFSSPHRPYLAAIKSKPFLLLAGISGTGKSRIVRELAKACWDSDSEEYHAQKPRNFEMVQVKPNWHDSSELIGYVSRIGEQPEFVAGDFIKFVARAWEEPEVPYFLCLDEMNLAPVEQYFAEFLSVMESRKADDDGVIKTDPIIEKSSHQWYYNLCNELTKNDKTRMQFLNEGIALPQNLIVVGTVNMDETTFSFSRKVLDRAMTIEMNEVDLYGGLDSHHEQIGKIEAHQLIATAVEGVDIYEANKDVCDTALAYLQAINNKLEGTPFKIAYRTRNEFLLYVVNNLLYNKDADGNDLDTNFIIAQALDEVTSMKILSRIEGDDSKVSDNLLKELKDAISAELTAIFEAYDTNKSISLLKLDEMKKRLSSGYTSFWS